MIFRRGLRRTGMVDRDRLERTWRRDLIGGHQPDRRLDDARRRADGRGAPGLHCARLSDSERRAERHQDQSEAEHRLPESDCSSS
jgi:hypothetical protein